MHSNVFDCDMGITIFMKERICLKKALTAERHAKWDEINYLITDSSISGEDLDK